jgi:hypothetical protein
VARGFLSIEQDRQQQRRILDADDRVSFPSVKVDPLARRQFDRAIRKDKLNVSFEAMQSDIAGHVVGRDFFAGENDEPARLERL